MKGLIGKKIGMTQIFTEEGQSVPVTVIQVGPCTVVQKKTVEKDGYYALQIGFDEQEKEYRVNKPLLGHFKKKGIKPFKFLKEIRWDKEPEFNEGEELNVSLFEGVKKLDITGYTKGRGFAGVHKRWNFGGGPGGHGSTFHRAPGSSGATTYPGRVLKGKKYPGHYGNEKTTVKGLKVVAIDAEKNLIMVKGTVPGFNGNYLIVKESNR